MRGVKIERVNQGSIVLLCKPISHLDSLSFLRVFLVRNVRGASIYQCNERSFQLFFRNTETFDHLTNAFKRICFFMFPFIVALCSHWLQGYLTFKNYMDWFNMCLENTLSSSLTWILDFLMFLIQNESSDVPFLLLYIYIDSKDALFSNGLTLCLFRWPFPVAFYSH